MTKRLGLAGRIHYELGICAQGCGQDIALRMLLGFFGADESGLYEASNIGVIAGDLRNLSIADQVEARVANVDVVESILHNRRSGAGGSHTAEFGMVVAIGANLFVGGLQGLDQSSLRIVATEVAIYGDERIYGETAGFLPAFVATHAVGYYGQAAFAKKQAVVLGLPIAEGVFVVLAHTTDVGLARYLDSGSNLHPCTTSIEKMTSIGNCL